MKQSFKSKLLVWLIHHKVKWRPACWFGYHNWLHFSKETASGEVLARYRGCLWCSARRNDWDDQINVAVS